MRVTHYAAHTHKNDNNKPKCRNQIHLQGRGNKYINKQQNIKEF